MTTTSAANFPFSVDILQNSADRMFVIAVAFAILLCLFPPGVASLMCPARCYSGSRYLATTARDI